MRPIRPLTARMLWTSSVVFMFFFALVFLILSNQDWDIPRYLSSVIGIVRETIFSVFSRDPQSARYLLSAIIQSVATVLTLIFTITLILLQLIYRHSRITGLFLKMRETQLLLLIMFLTILFSVLAISSIEGESPLESKSYVLFLSSVFFFIFLLPFIYSYFILCVKFLDSSSLLRMIKNRKYLDMEMISEIIGKSLDEGNMKAIEEGCFYLEDIFEGAYAKSLSSDVEFMLKNLTIIVKKSAEYGPETMKPFMTLYVNLMKLDLQDLAYPFASRGFLQKVFESVKPIIVVAIQSNKEEAIDGFFEQLSTFEELIKDNNNFRIAVIYCDSLRKTFQELLQGKTREKDMNTEKVYSRFIQRIFSQIEDIFSSFLEYEVTEIQDRGGRRQETLTKIIEISNYVGYNLIVENDQYLFDAYLNMLEKMYSGLPYVGQGYYSGVQSYASGIDDQLGKIQTDLKNEFFHLLFGLGVFALDENKREFAARILQRSETGKFVIEVNRKLFRDFLSYRRPEECTEWALRDVFGIFGSFGRRTPEKEVIQFYLLARSKALFREMKKNNPDIWDYPGSKLKKCLKVNSGWIFFEEEIPLKLIFLGESRDNLSKWKVSFVSEYIAEIKRLRTGKFRNFKDIPYSMMAVRRFNEREFLFQQAAETFTNSESVSQEVFGGALEQFLEITHRFVKEIGRAWRMEEENIQRSFPIDEKRRENAVKEIRDTLNTQGIFRKAVEWKKSDQQMLQETDTPLDEVLYIVGIESKYLKDLPISISFESFGESATQKEDKEILDLISEGNIRREKESLPINLGTIRQFLERLECETLVICTRLGFQRDLKDSGEIEHLKKIDNVYEVTIDKKRKAFIYASNLFREKTLIFARNQLLEILYLEKENIEIRCPKEDELIGEIDREDLQVIVISQRRGLRFLDLTKGVIIEQ